MRRRFRRDSSFRQAGAAFRCFEVHARPRRAGVPSPGARKGRDNLIRVRCAAREGTFVSFFRAIFEFLRQISPNCVICRKRSRADFQVYDKSSINRFICRKFYLSIQFIGISCRARNSAAVIFGSLMHQIYDKSTLINGICRKPPRTRKNAYDKNLKKRRFVVKNENALKKMRRSCRGTDLAGTRERPSGILKCPRAPGARWRPRRALAPPGARWRPGNAQRETLRLGAQKKSAASAALIEARAPGRSAKKERRVSGALHFQSLSISGTSRCRRTPDRRTRGSCPRRGYRRSCRWKRRRCRSACRCSP